MTTFYSERVQIFAHWVILHAFLSSAYFFYNKLFQKIISGIPSKCQTVWIQIRPNITDLGPNCLQRLLTDDTSS